MKHKRRDKQIIIQQLWPKDSAEKDKVNLTLLFIEFLI